MFFSRREAAYSAYELWYSRRCRIHYFHADKSGTLGRIALEYEVTKTNATHVTLQTVGPNNDPYLGVWNMNHYGTDQTRYYTSSGNLNDWNRTEKTLSSLYFREKGRIKLRSILIQQTENGRCGSMGSM